MEPSGVEDSKCAVHEERVQSVRSFHRALAGLATVAASDTARMTGTHAGSNGKSLCRSNPKTQPTMVVGHQL